MFVIGPESQEKFETWRHFRRYGRNVAGFCTFFRRPKLVFISGLVRVLTFFVSFCQFGILRAKSIPEDAPLMEIVALIFYFNTSKFANQTISFRVCVPKISVFNEKYRHRRSIEPSRTVFA
jgi:hypothetical protein